ERAQPRYVEVGTVAVGLESGPVGGDVVERGPLGRGEPHQPVRRSRARNIASVACRCGHSWTVGPAPSSGNAGGSTDRASSGSTGRSNRRSVSVTATRVSTTCGEQTT